MSTVHAHLASQKADTTRMGTCQGFLPGTLGMLPIGRHGIGVASLWAALTILSEAALKVADVFCWGWGLRCSLRMSSAAAVGSCCAASVNDPIGFTFRLMDQSCLTRLPLKCPHSSRYQQLIINSRTATVDQVAPRCLYLVSAM